MAEVDDIKDLVKNISVSAIYLGFAALGVYAAKVIVESVVALL